MGVRLVRQLLPFLVCARFRAQSEHILMPTIDLVGKRVSALTSARTIINTCKAAGRDLTPTEVTSVEASLAEVRTLDQQIKGRALVESVTSLGSVDDAPRSPLFNETDSKNLVGAVKSRSTYRMEV